MGPCCRCLCVWALSPSLLVSLLLLSLSRPHSQSPLPFPFLVPACVLLSLCCHVHQKSLQGQEQEEASPEGNAAAVSFLEQREHPSRSVKPDRWHLTQHMAEKIISRICVPHSAELASRCRAIVTVQYVNMSFQTFHRGSTT